MSEDFRRMVRENLVRLKAQGHSAAEVSRRLARVFGGNDILNVSDAGLSAVRKAGLAVSKEEFLNAFPYALRAKDADVDLDNAVPDLGSPGDYDPRFKEAFNVISGQADPNEYIPPRSDTEYWLWRRNADRKPFVHVDRPGRFNQPFNYRDIPAGRGIARVSPQYSLDEHRYPRHSFTKQYPGPHTPPLRPRKFVLPGALSRDYLLSMQGLKLPDAVAEYQEYVPEHGWPGARDPHISGSRNYAAPSADNPAIYRGLAHNKLFKRNWYSKHNRKEFRDAVRGAEALYHDARSHAHIANPHRGRDSAAGDPFRTLALRGGYNKRRPIYDVGKGAAVYAGYRILGRIGHKMKEAVKDPAKKEAIDYLMGAFFSAIPGYTAKKIAERILYGVLAYPLGSAPVAAGLLAFGLSNAWYHWSYKYIDQPINKAVDYVWDAVSSWLGNKKDNVLKGPFDVRFQSALPVHKGWKYDKGFRFPRKHVE